jgi:hypothetical protein
MADKFFANFAAAAGGGPTLPAAPAEKIREEAVAAGTSPSGDGAKQAVSWRERWWMWLKRWFTSR